MEKLSKAIIKISGRDFIVSENTILSTFNLNKNVGETINLPVFISFDENGKIINQTCNAVALVTNNYLEKKVHSFKKVNRTRFNRMRGSRAHCTTIQIQKLVLGGK